MRLLHTESLELAEFIGKHTPEYAILSHTWGDDEILIGDVQGGRPGLLASNKAGLGKVLKAASVAKENGFEYIWIDTCCIDKSSSAELSEAINSMFAWYSRAAVCYAYIGDFDSGASQKLSKANRWFTRGWTLQELIAPSRVEFYDKNWVNFGDRARLGKVLSAITEMDELALGWHRDLDCRVALSTGRPGIRSPGSGCHLCRQHVVEVMESFSVATRMSWAADRTTTREEDSAYSLLGIFGVNMPLLYGEGPGAFLRLQHEIVRKSATDHSIFAFTPREDAGVVSRGGHSHSTWLFARSASWFAGGPKLCKEVMSPTMTLTNIGVELELHIVSCKSGLGGQQSGLWLAVLSCADARDTLSSPAILLRSTQTSSRIRSFSRQVLRDGSTGSLVYVTAGSNGVVSKPNSVSFDPAMLKRETILLQDLQARQAPARGTGPRFIPPPSRVRLFGSVVPWGSTGPVFPTRHFVPPTLTVQARTTEQPERHSSAARPSEPLIHLISPNGNTQEHQAIVCGVVGFQLYRNDGIVVVWGMSRLPDTAITSFSNGQAKVSLPETWWGDYSGAMPCYTAVYPWTAPASGNGGLHRDLWTGPAYRDRTHHGDAMADEMTSLSAVQDMLDRCCAQGVPLKEASELIRRPDRGCERTWTVVGDWHVFQRWDKNQPIKVSVSIESVEFLGRRVMDIAVTVSPVETVETPQDEGGAKGRLSALKGYFF